MSSFLLSVFNHLRLLNRYAWVLIREIKPIR